MAMDEKDKIKSAKLRAVMAGLKNLEKATKKEGIAYVLGSKEIKPIETISTGSLMFDLALGVGGLGRGRIIEFFGLESSGKSLCATKAAAECQKAGGIVAIVDMEHSFDPYFAQKLGLKINNGDVIISQPDHLQDAFDVIDTMIDAGVDLIILDSVAALVPREELEADVGKAQMALVARYMSQFLRRITPKAAQQKSTVIFINQVRDTFAKYGDPLTTPGGRALKFGASVRVMISRIGGSNVMAKIGGEEVVVGHSIKVSVKKNKLAPPFRKAEFQLFYDGRTQKKFAELAGVVLLKGLCPKYDASNKISPNGRTYKYTLIDDNGEILEELIAEKKDEFADALEKCPLIQAKFLDILKNGLEDESVYASDQTDADLNDEEFEELLTQEINKSENEAEEIESSWKDI